MPKIVALFFLFFTYFFSAISQDTTYITIQGKAYDPAQKNDFLRVIVVNQSTGLGKFGNQDGSFEISCQKKDTLVISVLGYETTKITCKDSSYKKNYSVNIPLKIIEVNLPEVSVFAKRELKKIYEDINKLGYNEKDYTLSGVDAVESPITFLYQTFSRREKSKRLAIELQNEERRRDLLKELLARYVDANIISLSPKEFDVFIDYCKISDFLLQNTTQYQFIQIIREKYSAFAKYGY